MKISVITACFNSAKTILTAMESVAEQRGVKVDYIIVDGGSTDGTVALVDEFTHKKHKEGFEVRYLSEPDQGMYDAINKGLKMATGDVVGILNADDIFESPETLSHVEDCFSCGENIGDVEGKRIDAIYADIRFVRDDLQTTSRYYSAKHWRSWMLQWGKMPPHPSVYIRRELFNELGLYKLGYDIAADYELLIRYLRKAGIRTKYLSECVVRMRMGGKSTRGWRSNLKLNKEIVRGNRENGYFCCLPMLIPKYLFKIFEFILPRLGIN